jgi:hypothetical protein
LIHIALLRDKAILVGSYDTLKRDTIIKFKCNYIKNFRLPKELGSDFENPLIIEIKKMEKEKPDL